MEHAIETLALRFVMEAEEVAAGLPRYRYYLADQLRRSATSVYLNLREGLGEFSPGEKARFFRMSIRSGRESDGSLILVVRFHPSLTEFAQRTRATGNELMPQIVRLARYHAARDRA
ncbi:MAG TPA: four helix bundle protein [Longimicrobiales bacterium]